MASCWLGRSATNNQAEYWSLVLALRHAEDIFAAEGVDDWLVVMDSQVVVRQVQGQYAVRDDTLADIHRLVQAQRDDYLDESDTRIVHVRREHNTRADALSKLAMAPGHGMAIPDDLLRSVPAASRPYAPAGGGGGGYGGGVGGTPPLTVAGHPPPL